MSARAAGFVACTICGKLHRILQNQLDIRYVRCVQCGAKLHSRKPHSLQRTWALLLTGILLYVPANIYPIMITRDLGRPEENTIISGIIALWNLDAYLVAGVIFVASVVVPIMKFLVILYLLLSVHRKSPLARKQKVRLYHITEFIGPWSMVDIFVMALLVALVNMGGIASVEPGMAAVAFAAMVGVTMLAIMVFDPRLLWDNER
ncbi:MAG: paraquat-inducible protein A [Gammaproteobacteria bacterium]|nr:paraquat-inducible protein A [Gammaproteobacteria bacterium]NNJ84431.1 paraquat-inducible membrane protein A [Gammaproteobacteria bacterium]